MQKHISLPCVGADGTERFEGREAGHQLLTSGSNKNFTNASNSMSSVSRERNAACRFGEQVQRSSKKSCGGGTGSMNVRRLHDEQLELACKSTSLASNSG